jgi:DNA-binding NarL/FixJ family response regulator
MQRRSRVDHSSKSTSPVAAQCRISAKTVSVHVSHILHKLGAPNRLEAAAIAHRLAPPSDNVSSETG